MTPSPTPDPSGGAPADGNTGTPTPTGSVIPAPQDTPAPETSGTSPQSGVTAPGVPAMGTATAGDGNAVVTWTAPGSDGGSPIYGYEVQALDAETGIVVGVDVAGAQDSRLTMTDLTNGVAYAFWVRAVNAAGASAFSAVSNTVVPVAVTPPVITPPVITPPVITPPVTTPPTTTTPPVTTPPTTTTPPVTTPPVTTPVTTPPVTTTTVPGVVRLGMPSRGAGLAVVRWTAPADNGGSPILRYEVRVRRAVGGASVGPVRVASGTASQLTATGLANGTGYRFLVRAVNAEGPGAWSPASATVVPAAAPAAPARLTATAGPSGGKLTAALTWTAPAATGGSPVTGYRLTVQRLTARGAADGAPTVLLVGATARAATFTTPAGVRSTARYRFTLQAVNAVGTGTGRTAFSFVR